jgi:hypothetical protein
MTTGTNPDVRAAVRRWAAGLLGVQESATSVEARRAYFRKVRECDFQPPRSLHHALRVLDGKPVPAKLAEEWLLEEEGQLRADVESFAVEFFTLPVAQRRQHWDALFSRCQSVSPLRARLQALKAGVEVEIQSLPLGQSFHGQLAKQLLQSFPLPSLAQATSRQAFLRKIEEPSAAVHRKPWEKAAHYVLAEWPALAALDQELVQHIAKLRRRLKRQSKMHARSQRARRTASAASGKSKPWWLLFWIALGALSGILRGMMESNNSSSWRPPAPSYSAPHDARSFPTLEQLKTRIALNDRVRARIALEDRVIRMATDPRNGAKSVQNLFDLPPIHELIDPSKFDVEIINARGPRVLQFTPRPGWTTGNGAQSNNGQPVLVGEASLSVMGVSEEQMSALLARAAGGKRTDSAPKAVPEGVSPKPLRSAPSDKTHP